MTTVGFRTNRIKVPWSERKEKLKVRRLKGDIGSGNKESEFDQKSWQLRNKDDNDDIDLDDQEDEDVF